MASKIKLWNLIVFCVKSRFKRRNRIMLRDGWNFHGDIAIELESIANSILGGIGRPVNKIYDADCIETYSFAECMIILARKYSNFSCECDDVDKFVMKAREYIGVSGNSMEKQLANELFDEFKAIVNVK